MSSSTLSFLPVIFSQLLHQLPVLATCIVGITMLIGRRAQAPGAVTWAIGGFALTAAVSLLMPVAYGLVTFVQMQNNVTLGSISSLYLILGVAASLLHTVGYILFLVAFLQFLRPRAS